MVFLKEFFEKVDFGKKSADNKKHEKLSRRQRVSVTQNWNLHFHVTLLNVISGAEELSIQRFTAKIGYANQTSLNLFSKIGFKEVFQLYETYAVAEHSGSFGRVLD